MSFTKEDKQRIISEYQINTADTGSSEVQIAVLTAKIKYLSEHFKIHKKDNHSRMGLLRMVHRRRKLLKYLKSKDVSKYQSLTTALQLRG